MPALVDSGQGSERRGRSIVVVAVVERRKVERIADAVAEVHHRESRIAEGDLEVVRNLHPEDQAEARIAVMVGQVAGGRMAGSLDDSVAVAARRMEKTAALTDFPRDLETSYIWKNK